MDTMSDLVKVEPANESSSDIDILLQVSHYQVDTILQISGNSIAT